MKSPCYGTNEPIHGVSVACILACTLPAFAYAIFRSRMVLVNSISESRIEKRGSTVPLCDEDAAMSEEHTNGPAALAPSTADTTVPRHDDLP